MLSTGSRREGRCRGRGSTGGCRAGRSPRAAGSSRTGRGGRSRELGADGAAAALEHPEDVAGRDDVPGRQRIELGEHAARLLLGRDRVGRRRRDDLRGLALAGIGLAEDVILIGDDAVIVGGAAPQHRARRHQRALGRLDRLDMAGAAAVAGDPIVGRVDEADEFRALDVEQGVAARRVGARRPVPGLGIARQDVRLVARGDVARVVVGQRGVAEDRRIAAMAVGAAEHDRRSRVHRLAVAVGVARDAAGALLLGGFPLLSAAGPARTRP
jgi:hypothetical protein